MKQNKNEWKETMLAISLLVGAVIAFLFAMAAWCIVSGVMDFLLGEIGAYRSWFSALVISTGTWCYGFKQIAVRTYNFLIKHLSDNE